MLKYVVGEIAVRFGLQASLIWRKWHCPPLLKVMIEGICKQDAKENVFKSDDVTMLEIKLHNE
jgi:hypothetical protein